MADIKSTMDLVMARAARMGTASAEELRLDDQKREGMRLAAEFLDKDDAPEALAARLAAAPENGRAVLRNGMLSTLLRNLFLPRDEAGKKRIERAATGIVALYGDGPKSASNAATNAAFCSQVLAQLTQITGRYGEHRKQVEAQLKEQFKIQLQQKLASEAVRNGLDPNSEEVRRAAERLNPTMDPRYAQEWGQVEAELNSQYGQALEQCKAKLARLGQLEQGAEG